MPSTDAVNSAVTSITSRARPLVLLVDDCEDTRTLYAEYLALSGFSVKEVGDGLTALDESVSTIPDIVVMDLSLPGLGGREAAQRIKADPRTRNVPVVIVSGFLREAIEDNAGDATPWDEYLGKPCPPDELLDVISRLLPRRPD